MQLNLCAAFHRFKSQAIPKQQNFPQTCVPSHLRYPSAITRLSSVFPLTFLLSRNQRALLEHCGSSVPAARAARRYIMCVLGLFFCQWEHQLVPCFRLTVGFLKTCRNSLVLQTCLKKQVGSRNVREK